MKHIYRIFVALSITFLSLLLIFVYAIKPSSGNKGINKLKHESAEESLKKKTENVKVFDGDKPLRILVLGVDKSATKDASEDQNGMRTDTMMLFTIDPKYNKVQLVSIPRDSYVRIHGYDKNKINAAFNDKVYPKGGLNLTVETVEDLFDVKIDHYAIVDYKAVIGLVDAVGGIDIYWDHKDYHYEDNWVVPPLVVDLKRGENHLDGTAAVAYLRTRKAYINQDIGRIGAQQEFLLKLFDKMKTPSIVLKIPKLLDIVDEYVETDLNYGELAKLAYYGLGLKKDDIYTDTVTGYAKMMKQGKHELSFYIVNPEQAQKIVHDFPEDVLRKEAEEKAAAEAAAQGENADNTQSEDLNNNSDNSIKKNSDNIKNKSKNVKSVNSENKSTKKTTKKHKN